MKFKFLPTVFFFTLLCCQSANQGKEDTLLSNTCTYLWSQQASDGGWHSQTHGIMKSGQSLTPFILWSLIQTSNFRHPSSKMKKALKFIRSNVDSIGRLGVAEDFVLDYPNYATAYALRCLLQNNAVEDQVLIQQMQTYLISQQFTEQRGILKEHPAYGAWGFGETILKNGQYGHVDLSHTRRILETLRMLPSTPDSVFGNAQVYLNRLQTEDGSFFPSTVTTGTNKGGPAGESWKGYATATCDGVLAMKACGIPLDALACQKALSWLTTHPLLEYPEGIPLDDPAQWHQVMVLYHLNVRHKVDQLFQTSNLDYSTVLQKYRYANGSLSNPYGGPNKENDPLLATAYMLPILSSSSKGLE